MASPVILFSAGKMLFDGSGKIAFSVVVDPVDNVATNKIDCCGGPCWCKCGTLMSSWDVEVTAAGSLAGYANWAALAGNTYNIIAGSFSEGYGQPCRGRILAPSAGITYIEMWAYTRNTGSTIQGQMSLSIITTGMGGIGIPGGNTVYYLHGTTMPLPIFTRDLKPYNGNCLQAGTINYGVPGVSAAWISVNITPLP